LHHASVADYVSLVPSCVGISRLGKTLGRMGFALVFVIAIDYAPSRKSICDLSLTHIVLFIIIEQCDNWHVVLVVEGEMPQPVHCYW